MDQKQIAINFLKSASSGRVKEAYSQYVAEDFIHHNACFKGTREALLTAMEEAHQNDPNKSFEVKQCFEDGNSVITHSLVIKANMEIAVVHIFRFENEKIAELWDLGMVLDPNSPNANGPF